MDIISHGLWGSVVFGRKNKRNFWWAFLIGMSPDLFSFGIFWITNILGITTSPDWRHGHPISESIPQFVHTLYNFTHSFVIFLAVFLIIWLFRKKPFWLLGAWGLHILIDIPSHSLQFFPTPFLWPFSDYVFPGISWGTPIIFIPNLILLGIFYAWFLWKKYSKKSDV